MTDGDRRTGPASGGRQVAVSDEASAEAVELDHRVVRYLLSEYAEGTLAPPACERVRQHLDHCAHCRAFLSTLVRTIDLTRRLPSHQLSDQAKRRILDRLSTTADSGT